jgi:hypothetical protein
VIADRITRPVEMFDGVQHLEITVDDLRTSCAVALPVREWVRAQKGA